LLTSAVYLSRNELYDAAHRQMSAVLCRAEANGFKLMNNDDSQNICHPGLFKGLSGIGYTCLRLADRENVLPSVLLME
ncbi:MAG: lanthionine synthetase LanC family protein, partial [Acidobacteriota bacterium]